MFDFHRIYSGLHTEVTDSLFLFKMKKKRRKFEHTTWDVKHHICIGYEMENHENVFSLNCFGKINKTMFR